MKNFAKKPALTAILILAGCTANHQPSNFANEVNKTESGPQGVFMAISRSVGVEIVSEGSTSSGGGIWLGNGEVLSATHIFLNAKSPSDPIFVISDGNRMKATVVFHGNPPNNDLILLKIDPTLVPASLASVASPQICSDLEAIGAELYVTAPNHRIYSTYASPVGAVWHKGKTLSQSTTALLSHGVSGSPVYDTKSNCFAGIVSRMQFDSVSVADSKADACKMATLQMANLGTGSTCAVETQTIFMTSDVIQDFLKGAREYVRNHEET
ncbi:serine protease [Undibacterium sp. CY21W]|uniref:S1 family peptidase n=1 Tax=Undibacterium sp. CY21W TaxID=2762293 RepID=UPI00164B23BB|nr:serine protease [Undibacterium sp. CY21W]MBC3926753.1 trypsin-like peptidase domain-containing protein [Undibacterium sp. CY21W]